MGGMCIPNKQLQNFGLFRLTDERYLDCPFIILQMLIREIINNRRDMDNANQYLTRFVLAWQSFEQFVAFPRWAKSIAYREAPISLSSLHAGARFGEIENIYITEPNLRKVVDYDATSSSIDVMKDIVVKRISTKAVDISTQVKIKNRGRQLECSEVVRFKMLQPRQKLNEAMFMREKAEAVNSDSDAFLLITPNQATEFTLPPRCGIVSRSEFAQYFGPFASRASRSLEEVPNLNIASFQELRRIEGVGDVTATKIIAERKVRPFSSIDDALERFFPQDSNVDGAILRAMNCVSMGNES